MESSLFSYFVIIEAKWNEYIYFLDNKHMTPRKKTLIMKLSPMFNYRSCGSRDLPVVTSSSNIMTIQFRSDHSVTRSGFRAIYHTLNDQGETEKDVSFYKLN